MNIVTTPTNDAARVLVLDDNPVTLALIQKILKQSGEFSAVEAFDTSWTALCSLEQNSFDLLVLDYYVDELTGIDVFLEARKLHPDIAGLVITNRGDMLIAIASLRAGIADFIEQPIHEEILVRSLLRCRHAQLDSRTLAESERKYRQLMENLPDIVYKIDPQGNILYMNSAVERLGYKTEELIGTSIWKIIHPDDYCRVRRKDVLPELQGKSTGDHLAPKLVDERRGPLRGTRNLELRLLSKDCKKGSPASMTTFAELDSAGYHDKSLSGTIGIIRDRSERELAHQKLLRASKMSTLGELGAGIAHELNQPLTGIMQFVKALLEDRSEDHALCKDLEVVHKQSLRMAETIRKVLQFSRNGNEERSPVHLPSIIESTLVLLRSGIQESGTTVHLDFQPGSEEVWAVESHLQQVFLNLLTNALDAINGVESFESKYPPLIRISSSVTTYDPDRIQVLVSDNGLDIAPELESRLFEPFFTTKGKGQGTGLGLSLILGILEDSGGSIRFERDRKKNKQFLLEIPIKNGGNRE